MRYMARRVRTGVWVDRDVPLIAAERTSNLSGPFEINARLPPGYGREVARDGYPIMHDQWSTMIYAVRDDNSIEGGGFILPGTEYADQVNINCAGLTAYPQRVRFRDSHLYGPAAKTKPKPGRQSKPAIPRPDPIFVYRDVWRRMQQIPGADIGVRIVGSESSRVRIGNNAEPVRYRHYETPVVNEMLTRMAEETPFDYIEQMRFTGSAQSDVVHEVRIGHPRLGSARDDIYLAEGENVHVPVTVTTLDTGTFLIGVGKGDPPGPSMVYETAPVDQSDRLSLTVHRVLTDKTLGSGAMRRRLAKYQRVLRQKFDVTSVTVTDHETCPIGSLRVGDDLNLTFDHPDFGAVTTAVRILSIQRGEVETVATLTTSRSVFFVYDSITEELDS